MAIQIGHINANNQEVVERVGPSGSFAGQYTYRLRCHDCGNEYGANGCDIDGAGAGIGRKCPACQSGAEGDPIPG